MKKWFACLLLTVIGQAAFAQDMIVKRNAEEIIAKVLSVSTTEVEYRKFDNPEGPIYKLPIVEIFYIKYQNGTKDVFNDAPAQNPKLATGPGPVVQQGDQQQTHHYITRRPRFTHTEEWYPYYQGEIAVAYGLGVGLVSSVINTDRIAFETVHGARLCPYFFVGAGVAFNYFYDMEIPYLNSRNDYFDFEDENESAGIIPVFVNTKGYYPISAKCSFYLSLDLGAAIPATGLAKGGTTQFYTAVGPGINFGKGKNHSRGDFSIRFQHMGTGLNAMLFRIGYGF